MKSLFKGIKGIIILIFLIILFIIGYFVADGYKLYKSVINETSIEEKVKEIQSNPSYIKIDNVSKDYINAVISVEDKRFYDHFGIDIYSMGRALMNNLQNKKIIGGGSTITQQLAKNMYFEQKKKLTRKIAEAFVTLDLEDKYSKNEILELYINIIYFGDGFYGIKDACNGYLDKNPSELNLYEATLLAGIPNAPSVYQLSNNSKYTYQRQIMVINSMVENNYLSQEEANKLIEEIKEENGV
ncbi:MAG: transglycosylase domain-containing protein [Clostridia bacterium]